MTQVDVNSRINVAPNDNRLMLLPVRINVALIDNMLMLRLV